MSDMNCEWLAPFPWVLKCHCLQVALSDSHIDPLSPLGLLLYLIT